MSRVSLHDLPQSALPRSPAEQTVPQAPSWGLRGIAQRLGPCESRRRLLHMLPGLLPLFLWFIPHNDPWGSPLIVLTIVMAVGLNSFAIIRESDFSRPNESQWHMSVLGYTIPVVALLLFLPGRSELGLMTLGIVAFGDGSAALGGKLLGRRRLPWNSRKTWAGTICFFLAGSLMASLSYWLEARPTVPYGMALIISAAAAAAAAIVESLPITSHDNLRVGTTAALTGLMMQMLLLGS